MALNSKILMLTNISSYSFLIIASIMKFAKLQFLPGNETYYYMGSSRLPL